MNDYVCVSEFGILVSSLSLLFINVIVLTYLSIYKLPYFIDKIIELKQKNNLLVTDKDILFERIKKLEFEKEQLLKILKYNDIYSETEESDSQKDENFTETDSKKNDSDSQQNETTDTNSQKNDLEPYNDSDNDKY
jgi:hypothetical protein